MYSVKMEGPVWDQDTLFNLKDDRFQEINLPEEDLCNQKYDLNGNKLKKVLLILSSPRSGSTALCDYLYKNNHCIAHEYFQPFQYMPVLAKRWNSEVEGYLEPQKYFRALCSHRVNENGVLGINLHGSHLNVFSYFMSFINDEIDTNAIILKRKDRILQAVSYYIASETQNWSSHFRSEKSVPKYSFDLITQKLESILTQELNVDNFASKSNFPVRTVYYEDLCASKVDFDKSFEVQTGISQIDLKEASLQRQSQSINDIYAQRYRTELGI